MSFCGLYSSVHTHCLPELIEHSYKLLNSLIGVSQPICDMVEQLFSDSIRAYYPVHLLYMPVDSVVQYHLAARKPGVFKYNGFLLFIIPGQQQVAQLLSFHSCARDG